MTAYHLPVMVDAFLRFALEAPAGAVVDATLGGGGHVAALLAAMDAAGVSRPVIGVDQDPEALAAARLRVGHDPRFTALHGNFRDLDQLLAGAAPPAAILLDLGVSSRQLDAEHRGFAIKHPQAALDMRMDPTRGQPASALINRLSESELAEAILELGDEEDAARIARLIVKHRAAAPITTTEHLTAIICEARDFTLDRAAHAKLHPAARTFQALRILVNRELANLQRLLMAIPQALKPVGTAAIITFHSGEDRLVKSAFRDGLRAGLFQAISPEPLIAAEQEQKDNPRARSAKLRWARLPPPP